MALGPPTKKELKDLVYQATGVSVIDVFTHAGLVVWLGPLENGRQMGSSSTLKALKRRTCGTGKALVSRRRNNP